MDIRIFGHIFPFAQIIVFRLEVYSLIIENHKVQHYIHLTKGLYISLGVVLILEATWLRYPEDGHVVTFL